MKVGLFDHFKGASRCGGVGGGWGGCFSDWGASFLSGGMPNGWASVLMWGESFEKKGACPPMPPTLWETLHGE